MKFPAPEDINPPPAPFESNAKALFRAVPEGGLTLKSKRASVPDPGGKSKRLLKYSANLRAGNVSKS
ncbi:hypothetical protein [Hydrogenophaga sp.]|jgi:hypothetical protein|uniref:hypothetical protein n=1 Tax=Hydrogenophaga sp. TaxID=1904254 RepID=UPI00260D5B3A|nr:hypothetical protein [Hydrogenophaga sp.]